MEFSPTPGLIIGSLIELDYMLPRSDRCVSWYFTGLGAMAVLVLFPGYFIYHWGVYYAVWPPVAGGLFGLATAAALVGLAPALPFARPMRGSSLRWSLFTLMLLVYASSVAGANYALGGRIQASAAAAVQTGETLVLLAGLFLAGMAAPWNDRRLAKLFWILALTSLGLLGWSFARDAGLGFGSPLHESASTYQGLARSLMVCFLYALAAAKGRLSQVGAVVLGLAGLFLLGARSEFVGFGVGAAGLTLALRTGLVRRSATVLAVAAGMLALIQFAGQNEAATAFSRVAELLDVSESTSWQRRQYLTDLALHQIRDAPIFGAYGAHQAGDGTAGYAHNYLSAYVSFGLAGFLGFTFLLVATVFTAWQRLRHAPQNVRWRFSFALGVACLLLAAASKSIYWTLPALTWGTVAGGVGSRERRAHNDPSANPT